MYTALICTCPLYPSLLEMTSTLCYDMENMNASNPASWGGVL